MRARRRQAQRSRQCRLHRAASHVFRDARQFLVRRLFQGRRDRAGLESGHQGIRPAEGQADGDGLSSTTTRRSISGRRSRACRNPASSASPAPTISGRWATPAPAARARKSSTTTATRSGAARRARRSRTATASSRSGISCSCSSSSFRRRRAQSAAEAVDRHRHGAGAHRRRAAGQARQLRHRPVRRPDPRHLRIATGADPHGRAEGLASRDRRPSARVLVPDRRRRAALERGPRLCAAPDHAPRDAPRAIARRQGSR
jgi:hypothetical protein